MSVYTKISYLFFEDVYTTSEQAEQINNNRIQWTNDDILSSLKKKCVLSILTNQQTQPPHSFQSTIVH